MPIIKLKKYLSQNAAGDLDVQVKVSDKGALKDIPAFCKQQGLVCELQEQGVEIVFRIRQDVAG